MLVALFVVLFAARGIEPAEIQGCHNGSCFDLQTELTAAGLSIVIPCSFKTNENIMSLSVSWYKCESRQSCKTVILDSQNTSRADSAFRERVSLLALDLTAKNCSIIINNLTHADAGFYKLGVNGTINNTDVYMLSDLTNITVKADAGQINSSKIGHYNCTAHSTSDHKYLSVSCACTGEQVNSSTITWQLTDKRIYYTFSTAANCSVTVKTNASNDGKPISTGTDAGQNKTSEIGHYNCTATHSTSDHKHSSVFCACAGEQVNSSTITWQLTGKRIYYTFSTTTNCSVTVKRNVSNDGKPTWGNDPLKKFIETVKQLEVIYSFFIGVILATMVSTSVCCLMRTSHRKKLKSYGNYYDVPQMRYNGQEVEEDETNDAGAAVGGRPAAAGNSDVDYSTIKFTAKRAKKLEEAATETEYAEIKREEDGEVSQEQVGVTEEVGLAENWEGEDVALCPDVEVVVSEMEACSV